MSCWPTISATIVSGVLTLVAGNVVAQDGELPNEAGVVERIDTDEESNGRSGRFIARVFFGATENLGLALGYGTPNVDLECASGIWGYAIVMRTRLRVMASTSRSDDAHLWLGGAVGYRLNFQRSTGDAGFVHGPDAKFIIEGRWGSKPTFTMELALGGTYAVEPEWESWAIPLFPLLTGSLGIRF